MKKNYIAFLLISILFSVSLQAVDYSEIEIAIESYQKKVLALKETLNKNIFDDQELIIQFDFDAEKLVSFLQEKFVFQPYVGLLQGVQGTLNSRAGNALDQSVLLTKLLQDAGFESRIAHGKLSKELSEILVKSIDKANIPNDIGIGDEYNKALAQLTDAKVDRIEWQKTETFKRYNLSKNVIEKTLKQNNIILKNQDVTLQLIEQSKDYFWVEYRMDTSDDWKSAHPAFNVGQVVNVNPQNYIKGSIPEKYLHKLKIEVFIQQRVGQELKTHSLMSAWEKPVANLNNFVIKYNNSPSALSSEYHLETIVKDTKYFTPMFNGQQAGSNVFDLTGNLIDAQAMQTGGAGELFQSIGGKTLLAIDKVSGNENGKSSRQLTAQWLQFTFIQPDGSSYIQKRYLYQAKDETVNKSSMISAKLALMTDYSFLINTGEQSLAYLANVYLDLIDNGMPILKATAKTVYGDGEKVSYPNKLPSNAYELYAQYQLMNANSNLDENTIRFRSMANLIGFKRGFGSFETETFAVDIVNNRQNFIQNNNGIITNQIQDAMNHGIWETACEWLPANFLRLGEKSNDALNVTNSAMNQNIALKIIRANKPDNKAVASIFSKDKQIINLANADLNNGYSIIVPEKKPKDLNMTGWWRINLVTGETLGMTADGGGGSITEYSIQLAQVGLTLIRTLASAQKCQKKTNNYEQMCCLTELYINTVVGATYGSIIGGAFGTSTAAIFDITDFAVEAVTGSGIVPSTQGKLCKNYQPPKF